MRIAVIQDYLRVGGTERQTCCLLKSFKELGQEVVLLCFRPGGALAEDVKSAGIETFTLQRKDTRLNFWAPGLKKQLRRWSPDIVLPMGRMANAFMPGLKRALPDHCKCLATIRTGKPLPWHNKRTIKKVDAIITNTEWWRQKLISQGIDPAKITHINNGLTRSWDWEQKTRARQAIRKKNKADELTTVYLNVAGMRAGKRQEWLIERFAELNEPHTQLWIVGDGEQMLRNKSVADRLGVGNRVKLPGNQSDPFDWFAGADIAVSASIEDAQPNFLIEAQWMDLPCIATDYRGVKECFDPNQTGYAVKPEDSQRFTECMQILHRNPEQLNAMAYASRERALTRHDPIACARAYLDIFR